MRDDAALAAVLASLHDATLLEVQVDWVQARVLVLVRLHQARVRFTLEHVSHLDCPRDDPWGPSASINDARETAEGLEIEMQSGDTIRVVGELRDVAKLPHVEGVANHPTRRSMTLTRSLEVTGVRRKALGPRLDVAEVSLLVAPADHFERHIALEGIATPSEQRDFLDAALRGFFEVVLTDEIALWPVRVTVTNAVFDPIHSSVMAFRHAGRDAGRKLLAAVDAERASSAGGA